MIAKMEAWLDGVFKSAPQLSADNKKLTAQALPWIALIFGVLQLLSAFGLWNWLREAQQWGLFSNLLVGVRVSQFDMVMLYISIGLLVVMAVLLLLAYSPLRARARRGWELFFVVGVINVISGLVAVFVTGRGVGSLLFSVAATAVIFYFLLQVRNMYKGESLEAKWEKRSKEDTLDKK